MEWLQQCDMLWVMSFSIEDDNPNHPRSRLGFSAAVSESKEGSEKTSQVVDGVFVKLEDSEESELLATASVSMHCPSNYF